MEQQRVVYWCEATTQVELLGSDFHVEHSGLLLRTSKIDACLLKGVPLLPGERFLDAKHCPRSAGHTGEETHVGHDPKGNLLAAQRA